MAVSPSLSIVIDNRSSVPMTELSAAVQAIQAQIDQDVAPAWGLRADLFLASTYSSAVPRVIVASGLSTDPGALGFHLDDAGVPEAQVFPDEDAKDGALFSVTLSHEILEILGDPLCSTLVSMADSPNRLLQELCDPVEADADGYEINGVRVSNFVLPAYFRGDAGPWDRRGLLSGPYPKLRPGGYQEYFDGENWKTILARLDGKHSARALRSWTRRAWATRGK